MFLLFPESMMMPEMLERLRDSDFEDWLTAALIESSNQQSPSEPNPNDEQFERSGVTDLWMLEIAERTGKIWRGSFHVEFETEHNGDGDGDGDGQYVNLDQSNGKVMSFAINTKTGEIRIDPRGSSEN